VAFNRDPAFIGDPASIRTWLNSEAAKMNAKSVLLEAMQAVQSTSTNSTDTNVDGNISVTEHNDNDFFCF